MNNYNSNVTFNDVTILKYLTHFLTTLLEKMKVNYKCHVFIWCL